ncbi:hypothetical protein SAMN04487783_2092 [Agrococcus baldri]|uniref:Uncharacterized protein n=1 Tax=Agrococcus baldri TaxID=153730 RepID=A0AA94L069_9MICO|nr:hypothetical protein [Agrococcus baldri]SFS15642.1 hypothetical protein SAMN04487783_2092 [Agrococcus baldri]
MAASEQTPPRDASTARTRGLAVLLATTFLSLGNFAGLLAVVPLWASAGRLGSAAVGSTTWGAADPAHSTALSVQPATIVAMEAWGGFDRLH